jgi:lantibiotic modifying enzyme
MQNNNKLVSILTVISFLGLALPLPAAADDDLTAENVLSMAQAVGGWLANQAIVDARGTSWPDDVLNPEQVGYDLASGVAGKVVFFSGLYRATGNDDYLDMALGGADYLLSVINDPAAFEGNPRRASLYAGIAGIGVALQEAIRLSVRG